MQEQQKEILERMAAEFPQMRVEDKYYMAGYIMRANEEQARRQSHGEMEQCTTVAS